MSGAAPGAMSAPRPRRTAYQRVWLSLFWGAVALSTLFLILAFTGSAVPREAIFAVITGTTASLLGSLMITHATSRGIDDREFDDATAAMRVVVVAWLLLCVSMIAIAIDATEWGLRPTAGDEAIASIVAIASGLTTQLFGAGALFVVVGDGYAKYRRLLAIPQGGLSVAPDARASAGHRPLTMPAPGPPAMPAPGPPARVPWPSGADGKPLPAGPDGRPVFPTRPR